MTGENTMIENINGIWYVHFNNKRFGYFTTEIGAQTFLEMMEGTEDYG